MTLRMIRGIGEPMLGWFQALMLKEEKFFDLFEKHARAIVLGTRALRAALDGGANIQGKLRGGFSVRGRRRHARSDAGGPSHIHHALATRLGVPVSTTRTITGAIIGAGSARRISAVRRSVAKGNVVAWVLTMPAAALIGAAVPAQTKIFG
jgi:hypothetical protein